VDAGQYREDHDGLRTSITGLFCSLLPKRSPAAIFGEQQAHNLLISMVFHDLKALSAGQNDIARKYLQMPAALVALPFDHMTLNDIGCADRKAFR
jgi:hypothetical protein